MNKKNLIYQILLGTLYAVLVFFFLAESLKDATSSSESSKGLTDVVTSIVDNIKPGGNGGGGNASHIPTVEEQQAYNNFHLLVRKGIGHFGFFFVLGGISSLFYYSFMKEKRWYIWVIINLVAGIALAFISEFVCQNMAKGRYPSMKDVGIDSFGFIVSFLTITIIYLLILKRRKKKKDLIEEE